MRKKLDSGFKLAVILSLFSLFIVHTSFAVFVNKRAIDSQVVSAFWNVSLNQVGVNNSLTIVPENHNEDYVLNISSAAEVDIRYTIIVSNLPSGVLVALDNGEFRSQTNNDHTISFADAGTILYTDTVKTKSHTLTFKADSGATVVSNQTVNVNVVVRQVV